MISAPDNIYIIDERATSRARRLAQALNDLEARGKKDSTRYQSMLKELNGLTVKSGRPAGVHISVPRI